MDLLSGTRVHLAGTDLDGWTTFPEPGQEAPDVGMVLVEWEGRSAPCWEYVEDLETQ